MDRHGWNEHYEAREAPAHAEPHARLEPELPGLVPGRALDLACGLGRNAVWLATRGWEVTAVDFSEVALAAARRLAAAEGAAVEFFCADLLEYVPAAGAYDLVTVFFLHLPADERELVVRRAAAAVAPGGTLLVVGHDRENHGVGYRGPKDPAVLFTAEDVVPLLEGLELERAERIRREIETPDGPGVMIDALVRARRPAS